MGLLGGLAGVDVADVESRLFDVAYPPRNVTTESSPEMAELMHRAGFDRALRAVFALGDEPDAMWLALRERRSRAFGEHDVAFIRRIAPHVARALRRAALVDSAQLARIAEIGRDRTKRVVPAELAPSVVVIDDRWRVTHATAAAEGHLADLGDATHGTSAPTSALIDLVGRQRASGGASGVMLATVQGNSGRWYTVRAALSEPDELGRSSTVLIITPARQH